MVPVKINRADRLEQVELTVKSSDVRQTMDGFGMNINPMYWEKGALIPVLEVLHRDLEANLYRLDVYGQSDWIDPESRHDASILNEQAYRRVYTSHPFQDVWAMAKFLNANGIKPYLNASGVVPKWMCEEDGVTLRDYEAFSEMMASMLHWARHEEQIEFELFGPLNETDLGPPEGPFVNPEEYAKCMKVLVGVLDRWGLQDVKLVVAEQALHNPAFAEHLLATQKLLGRIAVLGMHSYNEARFDDVPKQLAAYPDCSTRFWMTEYGDLDETGEMEWEVAVNSTRRLLNCIQDGAQAGLVWDAFDNYHDHDKAWSLYGLLRRGRNEYTPKKRYFAAKHIYKFVKPGSVHIGLESSSEKVLARAFLHSAHGLTVVGLNQSQAPIRLRLLVEGQANRPFYGFMTNESISFAALGQLMPDNGWINIYLPADSIFTFSQSRIIAVQED